MQVVITGIGTAVPAHCFEQQEAGEVAAQFCSATAEQAHMLNVLYRMSGVKTRGSVILDRADGPLTDRQTFFPPLTAEFPVVLWLRGSTSRSSMSCHCGQTLPGPKSASWAVMPH